MLFFYGSWLKWFYDGCMFCDIQIYLKFSMYSTHVCRDTRLLNYGYISTCNWSCTPRERLLQIVWFFEVFDWVYCFFGNRRYLNKKCFFHSWYMVFLATAPLEEFLAIIESQPCQTDDFWSGMVQTKLWWTVLVKLKKWRGILHPE